MVSQKNATLAFRLSTVMFLQNLTAMLTVAFNQYINPVAIEAIGWWYYIVYCAWLVIELIFVVTYVVETKGVTHLLLFRIDFHDTDRLSGRTLEETAALFDGDQQPRDLIAMGGDAATQTMRIRSIGSLGLKKRSQKENLELHELKTSSWSRSQSGDLSLDEIITSRDKEYCVPREW